MRHQAAVIRAQAQEQAQRFTEQLAVAEKRAHDMGVEAGKRAAVANLNVVSGELKTVKTENERLKSKLDSILRDRADLEQELFDRDREFNEQKKKAAALEKQILSFKLHSVERTEFRAATAELRTVKNENERLKSKLDAAIGEKQGLALELSNRGREFDEQKKKAAALEKHVFTLKAHSVDRSELTAANAELRSVNSELRAARAENEILKKSAAAAEKSRSDMERRFAHVAELKAVALKLRNRVATLESEKAEKDGDTVAAAELQAKISDANKRVVTLERDNVELEQSLKRVKEAYEKERARAERERERAELAAKTASVIPASNDDAELRAKIIDANNKVVTLERDNKELAQTLKRVKEAYEKEYARAEKERERAEKADKLAEELDSERRRLSKISETKQGASESEMNARLEEEQRSKDELQKHLQKLNSDFEKERERIRSEHDSNYGSQVEINKLNFSAEAGDMEAQNALGEIYLYSKNADYKLAVHWFKEAAKKKHADAMYNLGICYMNGAGVAKNVGSGMGFIRMAARLGSEKARQYKGT